MSINAWGSNDPADVGHGGTGNASLTAHGILLGNTTSPVTVTAAPTNGQVLIGSTGVDPVLAVPAGTANQITVTGGAGTLTTAIASDPVFPGNASATLPTGTTGQQPSPVNGMMRYDSTTDKLRAVQAGSWVNVITTPVGSGGWVWLHRYTPSSSSVVAVTSQIVSAYGHYAFIFSDLVMTSSGANLFCQYSIDNGSTYLTSNYVDSRSGISTEIILNSGGILTTLVNGFGGTAIWTAPLSGGPGVMTMMGAHAPSSGALVLTPLAGSNYSTTRVYNALKFFPSTGNFTGTIDLYGIVTN